MRLRLLHPTNQVLPWLLWLLWLSIVSFADSYAGGKQPPEYPDPGLIQVVDKNERVYWGAAPLWGRVWPRAYGRSVSGRSYEASLTPPVKGLGHFASTSLCLVPLFHLFQKKDQVPAG